MTPELEEEYLKFKHVAALQQANLEEHAAQLINYRLEALRKRYELYATQGLNLDQVRQRERLWLGKIRAASASLG